QTRWHSWCVSTRPGCHTVNAYRATLNLPALPESHFDKNTFSRVDVRVSKAINLGRGRKIEGSLQVVNLLGGNNLGGVGSYQTNVRAATFGRILTAQQRQVAEAGVRFSW